MRLPHQQNGTLLKNRCVFGNLHQQERHRSRGNGHCGVQNDAERAMILVSRRGMDVRYLRKADENNQREAKDRACRKGPWPCCSITSLSRWIQSEQISPLVQNTQVLDEK